MNIKCEEDVKSWKEQFEQQSGTSFIVRDTYPHVKRYLFHKTFICRRSSKNTFTFLVYVNFQAMSSSDATKYPLFCAHLKSEWESEDTVTGKPKRTLWCKSFRKGITLGNDTSNAESSVRLFKDIVLSRCKAYNPVALLFFVHCQMETYYRNRLLEFAKLKIGKSTPSQAMSMLFAATSKDYRHNTGKRIAVNPTSRTRRRPGVSKGAIVVAHGRGC